MMPGMMPGILPGVIPGGGMMPAPGVVSMMPGCGLLPTGGVMAGTTMLHGAGVLPGGNLITNGGLLPSGNLMPNLLQAPGLTTPSMLTAATTPDAGLLQNHGGPAALLTGTPPAPPAPLPGMQPLQQSLLLQGVAPASSEALAEWQKQLSGGGAEVQAWETHAAPTEQEGTKVRKRTKAEKQEAKKAAADLLKALQVVDPAACANGMDAAARSMGAAPPPAEVGTKPAGGELIKVVAPGGTPGFPSSSGDGETAHQNMAVWAAAASAQQQQYLQQYQFYQQLRQQDAQRAKDGNAVAENSAPSRFKENFRPMRICKHLITFGICRQGQECTFGHTYDELHPASPDLPQDEAAPTTALSEQAEVPESAVPDMRLKKKKEMCGRFSRGECSLGKICPFAHSEEQLGTVGLAVCGKVKTRLCVFWDAKTQTAKGCIYGSNCNNAHGEWEIGMKRPPPELAPPMKRRREGESVIAGRQ